MTRTREPLTGERVRITRLSRAAEGLEVEFAYRTADGRYGVTVDDRVSMADGRVLIVDSVEPVEADPVAELRAEVARLADRVTALESREWVDGLRADGAESLRARLAEAELERETGAQRERGIADMYAALRRERDALRADRDRLAAIVEAVHDAMGPT